MTRFQKTAKGLVLALGLATGACATEGLGPVESPSGSNGAPPPAAATVYAAEAEEELAALRALDVVGVGDLLVAVPDEATACYNLPCEGWQDEVAAEVARQLPRLERFTAAAKAAAIAEPGEVAPSAAQSAADLKALRDLHIVQVVGLIQQEPVADANCYGLVCPGEAERVAEENRLRAIKLSRIAKATKGL